ncbi:MAG: hypothetical protein IKP75_06405 [Oscillospiraceae bacterium]|nr:hypothetical protein [Oscillospiraceae bacterium]
MTTLETAINLLETMDEKDIQMFISLFSRIYGTKQESGHNRKREAFDKLDRIIESLPPSTEEPDDKKALDDYFKEKYGL